MLTMLADFDRRLKNGGQPNNPHNPKQLSFWDLLLALELADPTSTERIADNTWAMVDMICDRFDLDSRLVRAEIKKARTLAEGLDAAERDLAKSNLLCLMTKLDCAERPQWKALQAYFTFVKACFSVLISTAIVEACFSGFTSMKDRHHSVLGDGRVLDALVSRQAVDVFANGAVSFRELELRQDAHTHRLPW